MKMFLKIAVPVLVAAFAVGCCNCRSYQKKTRRPLAGTTWQLIQLDGRSIQPRPGRFTLILSAEEHRIAGTGDCNRLTGSYRTDAKGALKIGPLASTRMACPDPAAEQAFIRAVESATHYDMDGPMLLLLSDGELRAVFQAVP